MTAHTINIVCPHCGNPMRVEIPNTSAIAVGDSVLTPIGLGIVTCIRDDDGYIEVKNYVSRYVTAFSPDRVRKWTD